jgi:hypothetical protein
MYVGRRLSLWSALSKSARGVTMQAFKAITDENYNDDYNIHSKVSMNTLFIFLMHVLHIYINLDENRQTWMNVDE